ncbi:C3HC zinc finger-like-domain-containing protein [Haematococcus lacustris]
MASALDRISAALGLLGKRKEPDVNNAELSRAEQGPSKRIVFRPWDQKDMHRRLETFKPLTWFAKPEVVGPVACASRGWLNESRDQLCCEFCSVRLRYPQHPPASTTAHDARQRASAMFAEQLVSKHDAGCPWRSTCCDDGVLACSNGTTDLTPGALQSGFAARTAQLLRVDRLPNLHPRTAAALVSTAASLFRPTSSTGPGPDPLAQQDAADTAAAALRRALGVRLPGSSSSKTAGAGEAGGDQGGDLAAVPPVLPAAPTHSQKAKLLALLGWECQELVGESSSLRGGHPAGKQGSQGPPVAFHPSACVYGLAHLGIASGSGKSRHGKGQADCKQGGAAAGEKAAPSRLSMANVVLSCPLCRSRVGLWNCLPGASASSLPAKQPPSTLDPPPPSPGHAAGSQTLTHPAQPALAPASALPCPSPKVSLFSTIAGGSYQAPARASMATVPGWSSPRTPQAAGRPSAASIPSTALHSPTSQPLAPAMQTALTPVFGVGGLASKPPVFGLNSFPAASASAAAAMTAGLSSPLRARGGAASPARCQAEAAGRGEQAPSRLSGPVSGSSAANGLSLNGGRGGVDAFDSLGQHRSWCPWVFTGSNTGAAASPAKLVKCGWLYLLEALEADVLEARPSDVYSMAGTPRAIGDDSIANGSERSIAATKDSIIATLRRM